MGVPGHKIFNRPVEARCITSKSVSEVRTVRNNAELEAYRKELKQRLGVEVIYFELVQV